MKRRKLVGLALFTATLVYLVASFLALYQNQRVELEKGMEEAIKAYSKKGNSEVKELSKDIDLLLEEKADISDLDEQRIIYDGSFARMEKNVSNVTNEITSVENNVTNITGKITELQNQIRDITDKAVNMQNQINDIRNQMLVMENLQNEMVKNKEYIILMEEEIDEVYKKIQLMENTISEKELSQDEVMENIQNSLVQWEKKMKELEGNILFYRFDEESQTLNVYGNKEKTEHE